MWGEDPAARACRQTHKALRVTRPVSPQARGSPARLAHPANTGTTFPPVPGVPSSRFTLWREGHAPDPVGWPGQEQSRCCEPAVPSKGRWVRAEADKTCGNPAARPSTLAAGSLQGCWGPRGRASPLNCQLGPEAQTQRGHLSTCPVPTTGSPPPSPRRAGPRTWRHSHPFFHSACFPASPTLHDATRTSFLFVASDVLPHGG